MGEARYNRNREYENLVNEYRLSLDLTFTELAEMTGATQATIFRLAQGSVSPFKQGGEVKEYVELLCEVLGASFFEIFPYEKCFIGGIGELLYDQIINETIGNYTLRSTGYSYEQRCLYNEVNALLNDALPTRSVQILIKVIGYGYEYKEVGEEHSLTGTMIKNIVAKSLRVLRHTKWSRRMRVYKGGYSEGI